MKGITTKISHNDMKGNTIIEKKALAENTNTTNISHLDMKGGHNDMKHNDNIIYNHMSAKEFNRRGATSIYK